MKNKEKLVEPGAIKLGWVHPRVIEKFKGLTSDQLASRRKAGKFIEGKHWLKDPVGTVMWNFEQLDEWIEGAN